MLEEILGCSNVGKSIEDNLDILFDFIPELYFMYSFPQNNPNHHLDVFDHTMLALRLLPSNASLDVKIALFFHDIGKPFCYQDVGGIRHFRGHPKVSSDITRVILKRLGYDNEYINKICYLIEKHDSFITKQEIIDDYDLAYKRYLIQKCDALAHHPDRLEKRIEYINNIKQLLKENK